MFNTRNLLTALILGIGCYLCVKVYTINNTLQALSNKKEDMSFNQNSLPNFVSLVKNVGKSVVNITVEEPHSQSNLNSSNSSSENDSSIKSDSSTKIHHVFGSGFIITSDGYIITSAHVIKHALNVTVKIADTHEAKALIIGIDAASDIALLKINMNNLNVAKVGNPNKLEVGEWVAAIGAQFGFNNSVTQGIVSAKNRMLHGSDIPYLQTDVPVNPGSSGGPLFNLSGEVVGVNSQIYSRGGGYMGVSFAIPIDRVMKIIQQLFKSYQQKIILEQYGLQFANLEPKGSAPATRIGSVIITQVDPGSLADKAGIIIGDKLIAINKQKITKIEQINSSFALSKELVFEINRNGQQLFFRVPKK